MTCVTAQDPVLQRVRESPAASNLMTGSRRSVLQPPGVSRYSSYRVPARPGTPIIVPTAGRQRADARTRGSAGWSA